MRPSARSYIGTAKMVEPLLPKATVTRQKRWNEWPGPSFHKLPLRHRSVRATRCSTRYSAGTETATPLRNMYDNS